MSSPRVFELYATAMRNTEGSLPKTGERWGSVYLFVRVDRISRNHYNDSCRTWSVPRPATPPPTSASETGTLQM